MIREEDERGNGYDELLQDLVVQMSCRFKYKKIMLKLVIKIVCKLVKFITFSYEVENARNRLRWNRIDERYAMKLDWSRLELVRILGKIKRPFNFIRNKSLKRN